MPRYLVERTFHETFSLPVPEQGEPARLAFIENNSNEGVIWIHSYVSPNQKKSYCIYEAPTPEAVRRAALHNNLPVDRIIEIQVLDPNNQHGFEPKPTGRASP